MSEARRFWSKILERKDHNKKAELINMKIELRKLDKDPQVNIHPNGIKPTLKKIANWKTLSLDGIHGFWFIKFTSINDRLATEMYKCRQKSAILEWMTKGKTTLIQKDTLKELPQPTIDPKRAYRWCGKHKRHKLGRWSTTHWWAAESSPTNKKDAARKPEAKRTTIYRSTHSQRK